MALKHYLMLRTDLRMAISIGLSAGLIIALGLPDAIYGPLAVSASLGGTVGNSWRLALQRIYGTLIGAAAVALCYHTLYQAVPIPVGVAITLGLMGLTCKYLGLQVGYRVGGLVVVMGYTAHAMEINLWIPMRIITTLIGLGVALFAINCFWPNRALAQHQIQSELMWAQLATAFRERAHLLSNNIELNAQERNTYRDLLLQKMITLQNLRPDAAAELGIDRVGRQRLQVWNLEDLVFSQFLSAYSTLMRLPMLPMQGAGLQRLLAAELAVLEALAQRCEIWRQQWPWGKGLGQTINGMLPLEAEKNELLAAEQGLFDDELAQHILVSPTGGRRASLCLQLISNAQQFEAAWAEIH